VSIGTGNCEIDTQNLLLPVKVLTEISHGCAVSWH